MIDTNRVLAVTSARSTPIKRLLARVEPDRVINMTYGYPRETVIFLEGGFLVVASLTVDHLTDILVSERINPDEPTFK